MIKTGFIFYFLSFLNTLTFAQSLRGIVLDAETGEPLSGALVNLKNTTRWQIADKQGFFSFSNQDSIQKIAEIRLLGYETNSETLTPGIQKTIFLKPQSLQLEGISITAREISDASSSIIDNYALKHVQPSSLGDVLQLVPGQLATNPDLSIPTQFTIRQAPAGAAAERMNALGTALYLDDAPLSNNSNLQINQNILNSAPGSLPPFSSVAGRGNDLRNIPADYIESVEVIRGIPSVRYGDLTAGTMLVTTLIGSYRPRFTLRLNPVLFQISSGAGHQVSPGQNLNLEIDYIESKDDPRDDLNAFSRFNVQLGWQTRISKQTRFTNRLSFSSNLDTRNEDPADAMARRKHNAQNQSVRLNSKLSSTPNFLIADEVEMIFSMDIGWQTGFFQEQVTRDIFPVTDALTPGTRAGEFGQTTYLNQTIVDGRPYNFYLRAETKKSIRKALGNHQLRTGVEFRHEGNNGEGRQFDPRKPPRQNYSMGDRPRSFRNIPAMTQIGTYLEDRWQIQVLNKPLFITAGVRLDLLRRKDNTLAESNDFYFDSNLNPRFNLAYQLTNALTLRAGAGGMVKMPTLSYLYPNPTFYDLVNFNYFAGNPAERLVILSTHIIEAETATLEPYRNQKFEAGFDLSPGNNSWQINFAFFHETMPDAIQMIRWLKPIPNPRLAAESFPEGQPPVLSSNPIRVDTFMAAFDRPLNNLRVVNRGFDFTVQTPEILSLNTSLNLNGAFVYTKSEQTDPFLDANRAVFANQFNGNVPLYPAGQVMESVRWNSSLRVIQHIPQLQIIVSGLIQTIWIQQNRLQNYHENPLAFMNRTGEILPIDRKPELAEELSREIQPMALQWQERPPLWLFNLRVTKEWRSGRGFAFYVNNLFNTRPLFENNITGQQVSRNQPEFFFGAEIYYTL
jgi:outer membrane receptor protein involved in Fe transport